MDTSDAVKEAREIELRHRDCPPHGCNYLSRNPSDQVRSYWLYVDECKLAKVARPILAAFADAERKLATANIEVDRVGAQCNLLHGKIATMEYQLAAAEKRAKDAEEDAERQATADVMMIANFFDANPDANNWMGWRTRPDADGRVFDLSVHLVGGKTLLDRLKELESDNAALTRKLATVKDAAEMLWVVLANVSGGDWTKQTEDWQEYAARWRDNYFAAIADAPAGEGAALSTPAVEAKLCNRCQHLFTYHHPTGKCLAVSEVGRCPCYLGEFERIKCAAIRSDGFVYTGPDFEGRTEQRGVSHWAIAQAHPSQHLLPKEQGFVTTAGRFVKRREGAYVATTSGQIKCLHYQPDQLFSEDFNHPDDALAGEVTCWAMHHDFVSMALDGSADSCGLVLLPGHQCRQPRTAYIHQKCRTDVPPPEPANAQGSEAATCRVGADFDEVHACGNPIDEANNGK